MLVLVGVPLALGSAPMVYWTADWHHYVAWPGTPASDAKSTQKVYQVCPAHEKDSQDQCPVTLVEVTIDPRDVLDPYRENAQLAAQLDYAEKARNHAIEAYRREFVYQQDQARKAAR